MRSLEMDELSRLARRQHGAFSRAQALAFVTSRVVRARLVGGMWTEIERGVYAVAGSPGTWLRRCWAATLLHPEAALSHTTAAAFLGLDGFARGRMHVSVPLWGSRTSLEAVVHRSRRHDFDVVDGLRCTTFERLVFQLARDVGEPAARRALQSGIHRRPSRQLVVERAVAAGGRVAGVAIVRALLDEIGGDPPPASELERLLMDLLASVPELPAARRQAPAPWSPARRSVVDCRIDEWRLIVEADGRAWHTRMEDFEVDRWRDAEALACGYRTLRLTHHRLRHDADGVIDQILRIGAAHRRGTAAA